MMASDRSLATRGLAARHVKLGRGGIREIELVVQLLQLRTGGPSASLRARGSLEAIEGLRAARVLPAAEARALASAYLFLRDVENKLQMAHDTQTHVLPDDEAGIALLARRMGYRDEAGDAGSQLASDLERHRNAVNELFRMHTARLADV
jgi:glutamate-ammonia-ligase adenylyltransferase